MADTAHSPSAQLTAAATDSGRPRTAGRRSEVTLTGRTSPDLAVAEVEGTRWGVKASGFVSPVAAFELDDGGLCKRYAVSGRRGGGLDRAGPAASRVRCGPVYPRFDCGHDKDLIEQSGSMGGVTTIFLPTRGEDVETAH